MKPFVMLFWSSAVPLCAFVLQPTLPSSQSQKQTAADSYTNATTVVSTTHQLVSNRSRSSSELRVSSTTPAKSISESSLNNSMGNLKKKTGARFKDRKVLSTKRKRLTKNDKKTTKQSTMVKKPVTPHIPYFEEHYCPAECSCYRRVVQCSDKNLEKIPYGIPYNSRFVLLMNNRIDRIQLNTLSEYQSMEFLVLNNNLLTDAKAEKVFVGMPSLKRLYIEQNLLRSIPADLPATLEELQLDRNRVSVLSAAAFSCCPQLLVLSLSNNSLGIESSSVPAGALLPLKNLRTLTLSYNHLTSVPLQMPINLKELYLRGNLIQSLQDDMFWGDAKLQILDLSANRLTNSGIGNKSFINASQLESLNLEGNMLKRVPCHLPVAIKTLNLEGNLISSINKDAFKSMPQLEHLGLARNLIVKVASGAFLVLPFLHQLDVSHNSLLQVPRQLPSWLHFATFSHNKIHTVPSDSFCWGRSKELTISNLVQVQLEYNLIDLAHLNTQAFRCLRGFQVVQFY